VSIDTEILLVKIVKTKTQFGMCPEAQQVALTHLLEAGSRNFPPASRSAGLTQLLEAGTCSWELVT